MQLNNNDNINWKRKIYMLGATAGTVFGLVASYLFARAAEEEAERTGKLPDKVATGQLIGIMLASLALIRQIAEMGRQNKK